MSPDFERLLRRARDVLPGPDQAVTRRARERALAEIGRGRRFRHRSALALVGALLLATAVGVGIGALVAPSGTAAAAPVGLGFLPERGWSVLQNGGDGTPLRPAVAVAANVPISREDDPDGLPYSTLLTLPPQGIVIVADFIAVGEDGGAQTLPLRARDAVPRQLGAQLRPERPLGQYELRAFVNGYAVDVQIYYGTSRPTPAALAAAQRQLDRLVVAPDRLTIAARPTVIRWADGVTLFGRIASDAEEEVVIEAKTCAGPEEPFRQVTFAHASGGAWSVPAGALSNTVFRARWGDTVSSTVTVRVRPSITLSHRFSHRYSVGVRGLVPFWRKYVVLQRYNRQTGAWVDIRRIVLTEQGNAGISIWTSAEFRLVVPRRTLLRAVLPLSQARPCYAAGYSNLFRT